VSTTTDVVSLNLDQGEVYNRSGQWFSPGTLVSFTNQTDRHDKTEILLKVALDTIKQTNKFYFVFLWFRFCGKILILNIKNMSIC
jgi:hypothetical protein